MKKRQEQAWQETAQQGVDAMAQDVPLGPLNATAQAVLEGPGGEFWKRARPEQVMQQQETKKTVDAERVREAMEILQRYKAGKANLEAKIVQNEQWWKLRHWDVMPHESRAGEPKPKSGWLFNCLANKHADAMDNYPSANILPREEGDVGEAQMLASILPVVLEQNDFEACYDAAWWYKLKQGCGVYGVFYNPKKLHGLGDVEYRRIDLLNLFWEPGVTDIQESPHLFCVEVQDNEQLEAAYPQLHGKLSTPALSVSRYLYDDAVDTADKSAVVDWYYKQRGEDGREVLHYVKFVADEVLYASENDPAFAARGWYDHGQYPFVFDVMFPEEGTPAGYGYIDICKDAQGYIDQLGQAILENALEGATPGYFVREDGGVNEEEFNDRRSRLIHVAGNLGEDSIRVKDYKPLSGNYINVLEQKIQEMKETSGNRDVNSGGSTSGVTAASAIAAMQEAGSKLSRDMIKAGYRAFRQVIYLTIELVRQFYDAKRAFRIVGANGEQKFVWYDNEGLQPQNQGVEFGVDMGYRTPEFDIKVTAEKANPYSRMSQNELAMQLYNMGLFNPQLADQSLMCLEMMDFDGKDKLIRKIQQNGLLQQQVLALQQQVVQLSEMVGDLTGVDVAGAAGAEVAAPTATRPGTGKQQPTLNGGAQADSGGRVERTRQEAAERSTPR